MIKADALHPLDLLHVVSCTRGGPRRAAGCGCDPALRASRISSQDLPATEKKEGLPTHWTIPLITSTATPIHLLPYLA